MHPFELLLDDDELLLDEELLDEELLDEELLLLELLLLDELLDELLEGQFREDGQLLDVSEQLQQQSFGFE